MVCQLRKYIMGFPNHGKSKFVTIPGQIEKGDLCLQIVEMNCTTERKQTSRNLIHNGEGSFFINGQLDIDLPGYDEFNNFR